MPWTTKDVSNHTKAAKTAKQKRQWVAVANSALEACEDEGGDDCEASAIRQANAAMKEGAMAGEVTVITETTTVVPSGSDNTDQVPSLNDDTPERLAEIGVGLDSMAQKIRNAYYATQRSSGGSAEPEYHPWIVEVFYQHPDLGNMVIVDDAGALFGIKYKVGEDGAIDFEGERRAAYKTYILEDGKSLEEVGKRLNKKQLAQLKVAQDTIANILHWADYADQEEPVAESFQESASGHVVGLAEVVNQDAESIVPLHLEAVLIEPGWGNPKDGHFYPREVLERDASVFEGVKMFETDHRPDEKSTRTWVSTIKEVSGFTDDGAPIGLVSIHDKDFAERILALEADDLLEKMECSILAGGMAREGKVGGKEAKVVESITEAESVDWVTRAGAGGRARNLVESAGGPMSDENETETEETEELTEVNISEDEETETPAPDPVSKERMAEMLGETNLPDASQARLSEAAYADEDELDQAIKDEIAYVKELTGSGQPFGMNSDAPTHEPRTEEQAKDDYNRVMREVGGREV